MIFPPEQFATDSLRRLPMGNAICQVLAAALNSADAGAAIKRNVSLSTNQLDISGTSYHLDLYHRIFVIGAGKAAVPMATAIYEILGNRITAGLVITKDGYVDPNGSQSDNQIKIIQAGHPIPDLRNLDASSQLISTVNNLAADDLVLCLFSGGGSALLLKPAPGISLKDIQDTISLLLNCGATIDEINSIRKHLDDIKGGKLARLLYPASVIALVMSDVIGDRFDVIASGPTVADLSTYQDALEVLKKYQLSDLVPSPVVAHLVNGSMGKIPETIKPGDPALEKVQNVLIANNHQAAMAALRAAQDSGFSASLLASPIQGEASQVGLELAKTAISLPASAASANQPTCLIAGGETTVTIKGTGLGGRNQELALGAVKRLSGKDQIILISLATDGGDGPTDAAGAVVTNQTYSIGMAKGLNPSEFLENNDSYHYFEPLGDLIKTGPTLTNVNDLVFLFRL